MNHIARYLLFAFSVLCTVFSNGQDYSAYIRKNAIKVEDTFKLSDSVYKALAPYNVIMMGEMHGTNEPAEFVAGMTRMFLDKGDSVQLGLEIPPDLMQWFIMQKTDSSIYQSIFFQNPPFLDGRQSFAWAKLLAQFNKNKRVEIFFFDLRSDVTDVSDRDSMMYMNIRNQFMKHPSNKMITLSGNVHNRIMEEGRMGWYMMNDSDQNISRKTCSLNHFYLEGYCNANYGKGMQVKQVVHTVTTYDTSLSFPNYFLLMPMTMGNTYSGFYYTKYVTPSDVVKDNFDAMRIKQEFIDVYERDQKTRSGSDSAQYMNYIDSINLIFVERMIRRYGWPGLSLFDRAGNTTTFAVIQHADSSVQQKYYPMLERSVADSESNAFDMALMQDRILIRKGKKQIYGSQVMMNKQGGSEFYPIEDEKNVNVRRAKVGLEPIEEYAKYFGIEYLPRK
jgi:hypothetical protein